VGENFWDIWGGGKPSWKKIWNLWPRNPPREKRKKKKKKKATSRQTVRQSARARTHYA